MEPYSKSVAVNELGEILTIRNCLSDEALANCYLALANEGLLEWVFYEGVPGLRWFLDWHARPDNVYLGCFVQRPKLDVVDLAGLGWINTITERQGHRKAECGMVFVRQYQDRLHSTEFAEMMIDYSFQELKLNVLYGTTPHPNRAALAFSRRVGFRHAGVLPEYCTWHGEPCAAVISYMTRKEWGEGR